MVNKMNANEQAHSGTNDSGELETAPSRDFDQLPAAAQRALKEAEARRIKMEEDKEKRAKEIGGRGGEDPARFGDWEVKGIAVDF